MEEFLVVVELVDLINKLDSLRYTQKLKDSLVLVWFTLVFNWLVVHLLVEWRPDKRTRRRAARWTSILLGCFCRRVLLVESCTLKDHLQALRVCEFFVVLIDFVYLNVIGTYYHLIVAALVLITFLMTSSVAFIETILLPEEEDQQHGDELV
jgi:hypothetical protein